MVQEQDQLTGRQLYDFRKQNGLSQQDVAAMVGVSLPTVKRWESGRTAPTDRHLFALKTLLGQPVGPVAFAPVVGATMTAAPMGLVGELVKATLDLISKVLARTGKYAITLDKAAHGGAIQQLWSLLEQLIVHFPIPRTVQERQKAEKVQLSVEVDRALFDKFQEEATLRGLTQSRLVEAMFWLFLEMPRLSFQENRRPTEDSVPGQQRSEQREPNLGYT